MDSANILVPGSPAAGVTTLGVERPQPLFHLLNGDLCYANLASDRLRSWWDFWGSEQRLLDRNQEMEG